MNDASIQITSISKSIIEAILSYYNVNKISLPPLLRSRNINSTSLLSCRIHVHSMVANIFLRFSLGYLQGAPDIFNMLFPSIYS